MEIKYKMQYLYCVLMWITNLGIMTALENKCHRVQTEFINKKIGPANIVPDNPVHDSGIHVCFNAASDSTKTSCCTKQSEQYYMVAAEKYLKDSVHAKNAFLKKLILNHISEFEERISLLITSSENRTGVLLRDIYKFPGSEFQPAVSDFFSQLKLFMKQKHISLYGTVATFFDKIFPSVIKKSLHNGTVLTLAEEKCIQSSRQDITPQPFGYIPYNISHSLNRALSNVKLYLEVLSLIVEAINSTDYASMTEKCIHQVTNLQFCAHCQNETNVKPCKGLCLNTMRRCLAQFSILHREWNGIIMSVVRLEGGQSQTYNVENILKNLDFNIDQSIGLAVSSTGKFIQNVKDICHITAKHSEAESSPLHPIRIRRSLSGDDLYDRILTVMKELLTSLHMFNTVSDDICGQEILYEQQKQSSSCWNGTAVGSFNGNIEQLEAFTSSEMEVDENLKLMKEKLAAMKQTLDDHQQEDNSMMSDSTVYKYGSGDRDLNYAGGIQIGTSDDEDINGSGSADDFTGDGFSGSTPEPVNPDVTIRLSNPPDKPLPAIPPSSKNPTGVADHASVSIATVVLTVLVGFLV